MNEQDLNNLVLFSRQNLPLQNANLSDGYFYDSLPLCVIDAIFSIGVKYTSVINVINNVVNELNIRKIRENLAEPGDNYKVIDAINDINKYNHNNDFGAETLFKNFQRTSTTNGILKSEAVYKILNLLYENGINDFNTLRNHQNNIGLLNDNLETLFKSIPGQHSGVSLSYFYMLTGNNNFVKVDRWILRFIKDATGSNYQNNIEMAQELLRQSCYILCNDYPQLNPRLYDHTIWNYMSNK